MSSNEPERPHFEPLAIERLRLAREPGLGFIDYLSRGGLWAITAGGTTGVGILFLSNRVAANDTLSFIGAMIGAAATVAGAASLANWKEAKERRQEQEMILGAINEIRQKLSGLVRLLKPLDDQDADDNRRAQIAKNTMQRFMYTEARAAEEYFAEVIRHAKTLNFYQRQSVKGLQQALNKYCEIVSDLRLWDFERQRAFLERAADIADVAGRSFSSRRITPFSRL